MLRAHGHTPRWVKGKPGQFAAESRAALRTINLHFHDLRREFACTLLESSADLHDSWAREHHDDESVSRQLTAAARAGARSARPGAVAESD